MGNYKFKKFPTDLDIYINPKDYRKAIRILIDNGWIRLINPIANYKNINHFYLFSKENTYHLHVYFGLRTGDSWLKNYYFSIDKFILKNIFKDKNQINILNNEAFHLIFNTRIIIKNSTIIGRILYKLSINKYKKEASLIDYKKIKYEFEANPKKHFQEFISSLRMHSIRFDEVPNIFVCRRIIRSLENYSLINHRTILLRQFFSLFIRSMNKIILRFNKLLSKDAKIITIYGSDGSGKTTIVKNLVKIYRPYFPCSSAHLGKPFKSNRYFSKLYSRRSFEINNEKINVGGFNFIYGIKSLILSLLRLFSSIYQVYKKNIGITVFTDRWPSVIPNCMDGPKLFDNSKNDPFITLFNFLNKLIYKLMPSSDMVIFLDPDLNQIIQRNSKRNQPENEEFIVSRYNLKKKAIPKSYKIFYYKNNKNLTNTINDCLNICANCLSDR